MAVSKRETTMCKHLTKTNDVDIMPIKVGTTPCRSVNQQNFYSLSSFFFKVFFIERMSPIHPFFLFWKKFRTGQKTHSAKIGERKSREAKQTTIIIRLGCQNVIDLPRHSFAKWKSRNHDNEAVRNRMPTPFPHHHKLRLFGNAWPQLFIKEWWERH